MTAVATRSAADSAERTGANPFEGTRIAAVEPATADDHLTVRWSGHPRDMKGSRFHYLWLRANCRCGECFHPHTWERTIDSFSIDPGIAPTETQVVQSGAVLKITWPDGHESLFGAEWLAARDYDGGARKAFRPRIETWGTELGEALPEREYDAVMGDDGSLRDMLLDLRTLGLSVVRGVPGRDGEVERVARRIAFLRETNFGVGFQVESKPEPNNVAYTALELKAHTDLPNREMPPGIQFLHCHYSDAPGGESLLVDGFRAAERLRDKHPDAFDVLTRIPVPFRFLDSDWDIRWRSPTIRLDHDGALAEVRYHDALTAPLDAPFEEMPALYDALQRFTEILRDPSMELRLRLEAGDLIAFHNRRVLHGRGAFDPTAGGRKLEGCYVDCDDAWSRLRVLERE